jgi:hypothetical protein
MQARLSSLTPSRIGHRFDGCNETRSYSVPLVPSGPLFAAGHEG